MSDWTEAERSRLEEMAKTQPDESWHFVCTAALREIERLRAELSRREEAHRATIALKEEARAEIERLRGEVREIEAFRLRNLAATCPCIVDYEEPGCDHGASVDPIMLACRAALRGEVAK